MGQTTSNWLRLESLFEQAVTLPPPQREAFIAECCEGDALMITRLRHMLSSDADAGLLDAGPLRAARTNELAASLVGRRVGDFQVLRVIAAGGMGTVYEAQQEHPPRRVALKVLSTALASHEARRRFEFEAETLARLSHPCIAAIFESGVFIDDDSPHGRPWFAMELIDGEPCTRFADHHALSIQRRVQLLIRVCEGVEHAHSRGIIHRDLKPANILVEQPAAPAGSIDDLPVAVADSMPRILDFGIARTIDPQRRLTRQTSAGQILGTLAYMSPEQVAGDPLRIDQRSDVYALGVLAYELLGGRVPHDVNSSSMAQALRVIAENDPQPLGALDRRCRGDLETIVARALEKDPDRRYQSPAALAEDLRRYLAHEPIIARRSSRLYQMRKFARRNRALVAGVAGVFLALSAGVVGTAWQWASAVAQRDIAVDAEGRAQHNLREANAAIGFMHEFAEQELSNIAGAAAARLALAQRALAQQLSLPATTPTEIVSVSYAHQRVGDVMLALGRSREALQAYETTLALRSKAVQTDLADPATVVSTDEEPRAGIVRTLAVAHFKMFDVLQHMGRFADSESHARQSLERLAEFARIVVEPLSAHEQRYLSFAHRRLGDALVAQGRADEALEHFALSLQHADAVTQPDAPVDRQGARGHAMTLRGWGDALALRERWDEALAQHRASLAVVEAQDAVEGPGNVWERATRSRLLCAIAADLQALGESAEALRCAQQAVEIAGALAAVDGDNIESQYALGHALLALAQAHADDRVPSQSAARQAASLLAHIVKIDPDHAAAALDLGQAQSLE